MTKHNSDFEWNFLNGQKVKKIEDHHWLHNNKMIKCNAHYAEYTFNYTAERKE